MLSFVFNSVWYLSFFFNFSGQILKLPKSILIFTGYTYCILTGTKFLTTSGAASGATWGAPCGAARGGARDETTAADDAGADAGVLRDRLLILLWSNTYSGKINIYLMLSTKQSYFK